MQVKFSKNNFSPKNRLFVSSEEDTITKNAKEFYLFIVLPQPPSVLSLLHEASHRTPYVRHIEQMILHP
jgi:hypothetical protein